MNEGIKKFLNNETYILAYRNNYDSARELNQQLIDYVKNLQNRIDKAIEYINDLYFDFYDYECDQLIVGKYMVNDLLDILKESGD